MNGILPNRVPRVLTIAESDPCGAAGIQGDVKTILALGGYAMTATTAVMAHRADEIKFIQSILPSFVTDQLMEIATGGRIDAIKIGYLHSEATVNAVADFLEHPDNKNIPVIVDPSLLSRSGKVMMDQAAISALKRRLYVLTNTLTPNVKEAEILGVMHITNIDEMRFAADMMRTFGVVNVVLKAGQVDGEKELYFVATEDKEQIYQRSTIQTKHTIGAGNVLSSAIAVNLSEGKDIFEAVESALDYMHQTIVNSEGFGEKRGPVNHGFHLSKTSKLFHPEEIKIYKLGG